MGRAAAGVRGIRLRGNDEVIGMDIIAPNRAKDNLLLAVMAHGFGKRTDISEYKVQSRGGSGVKTANITSKTGQLAGAMVVPKAADETSVKDLIAISGKGQTIRLPLKSISILGRATQGVRIMTLKEPGDQVASVAVV
jgi:DNA gyrase subunit A